MTPEAEKTTKELIREEALRLMEKEGPPGVTMRRIAGKVGITPMAIYHHYSNRDVLLEAVVDGEFERLAQCFDAARRQSSKDSLMKAISGYIDYALSRPKVFDFVFAQPRKDARQFPADFRARKSPTLTLIADEVDRRMETGNMRKDDVWEVALTIWGLIHGLVVLYRGKRIKLSETEFRALCMRSLGRLVYGLRK